MAQRILLLLLIVAGCANLALVAYRFVKKPTSPPAIDFSQAAAPVRPRPYQKDPLPQRIQPLVPPIENDKQLLLKYFNVEREKRGAKSLAFSPLLQEKAQEHAEWMVKTGRMQHSKLAFGGFAIKGENIAYGYDTENGVVNGWMNSSGHRRNILNKRFTDVGFGHAKTSRGVHYWCAILGGHPRKPVTNILNRSLDVPQAAAHIIAKNPCQTPLCPWCDDTTTDDLQDHLPVENLNDDDLLNNLEDKSDSGTQGCSSIFVR